MNPPLKHEQKLIGLGYNENRDRKILADYRPSDSLHQ